MAFDPKAAAGTSFGTALGQSLRSTFGNLFPLGLVLLGLSLIPFGNLLFVPLIAIAAVLGLRGGRRLAIGEIFSGLGSRLVPFILTFLVSLLFGFLIALPVIIIVAVVVITALGSASALNLVQSPELAAWASSGWAVNDPALLASDLMAGFGVVLLILFVLLIPILYLTLRLSLAFQATVDGASGFDAFRRSWALTKGSVWRTFGWSFGAGIVALLITAPIALVSIPITLSLVGTVSMDGELSSGAANGAGLLLSALGGITLVLTTMITEWMRGVLYLRQVAVHGPTKTDAVSETPETPAAS